MNTVGKLILTLLLFIGIFVWTANASAQADFYKGKTITVYIGTTAGALYDQWGRILAMHMSVRMLHEQPPVQDT